MLELAGVNAFYGDSHVLQDVGFTVSAGACVGLLGRNGVGKTTTLRTILGYVRATTGSIRFEGDAIERQPTHAIVRRGMSYVPEDRGIFRSLTVEEHLKVADRVAESDERFAIDEAYQLFPRLAERRRNLGSHLSGGEQQMLAIARALVGSSRFVIMDEPTEGLAPVVIDQISEAIGRLRAQGTTMLLVETNFHVARRVCDRACLLDRGRVVYEGAMADLGPDHELVKSYIGV